MAVVILAVPDNAYPAMYVRVVLSIGFVLFLPGYAIIKALFPFSVPIKTGSEDIDRVERFALSLGMSIAFAPLVALLLNFTPWGIRLSSVTFSLLAVTVIFATAAMLREYRAKVEAKNSGQSSDVLVT
jgi:uncharacterized membrane protein